MGALGFEPRSAGFYCKDFCLYFNYRSSLQLIIIHPIFECNWSVNLLFIIPITGASEDAVLPHAPYADRSRATSSASFALSSSLASSSFSISSAVFLFFSTLLSFFSSKLLACRLYHRYYLMFHGVSHATGSPGFSNPQLLKAFCSFYTGFFFPEAIRTRDH